MPRVIAGTARGRPLKAPPGAGTRPTADRVKEALFSSLAGALGGAVVLDLYAGSGGLAIEALSRGAARAVLVEQDRRAAATIRGNLRTTGVADRAVVVQSSAAAFCRDPDGGPFDLVLADPPYRVGGADVAAQLWALADAGALADGAAVVVERASRDPGPPPPPQGPGVLEHDRDRLYGEVLLRYLTWHRGEPPTAEEAPAP